MTARPEEPERAVERARAGARPADVAFFSRLLAV